MKTRTDFESPLSPTVVPLAGCKRAMANRLVDAARTRGWEESKTWIEPFVGAGHATLVAIQAGAKSVWLNDLDSATAAMWTAIRDSGESLAALISDIGVPTPECIEKLWGVLDDESEHCLHRGAARIVIGGALYGGVWRRSTGYRHPHEYWVKARVDGVLRAAEILSKAEVRVSTMRAQEIIVSLQAADGFVFLDPPYVQAGQSLYRRSLEKREHLELSAILGACRAPWMLTIDDCRLVREAYGECEIEPLEVPYRLNGRSTQYELLVSPRLT